MNLAEPFIRRPVMTVLLSAAIIALGVFAYLQLPVNDLPAVDYPVLQVNVAYPGASPQTMANNVATPLERQFMQIEGLELVTSRSGQGNTSFTLQFRLDKSLDGAATDVQTAITQATAQLPTDLPSPPTVSKTNPNDQPIMYIALTSNSATQGKVYDYANTQAAQQISILKGVSKCNVYGTKSAIRIKADPSKLAARGLTLEDLSKAIKGGTSYTGSGQFDNANDTMVLQPQGQLETAEQYNKLIIAMVNNSPLYLSDVATATETVQDERIKMEFWTRKFGAPSATVVLAVNRQVGSNAVEVAQSIHKLIPRIRESLPPSIRIDPIFDRSRTIVNSVNDVKETLLIAFGLVVLVIFLFLGRASDTLIPAVALPMSLLLTFIGMWWLNYSFDNLSLMALTLAIGFLVDDAIVFLENTVRRMETGEPVLEATLNSAKEISFTIVSMTLSLAAVFLPLVLMSGLMGRIFREFSVTIIIAIFASGFVSLTLTPMMCSRMLGDRGHDKKKPWLERVAGAIERRVLAVYGATLTWALRHHWLSAITWVACLVGTFYLFTALPKSFLPVGDSGLIFGIMIGPDRASYLKMREYQEKAGAIMQKDPSVAATFTMTGNGQFLSYNQGLLLAFLEPRGQRPDIQVVNGGFYRPDMLGSLTGVLAFVHPHPALEISTGATNTFQGTLVYVLSGVDPDEVYKASEALKAKLYGFPGFASVTNDYYHNMPNLEIKILRDQASMYGVSVSRIESLLYDAFSQNYVYLIKRPNDQYQVILEAEDKFRRTPDDLTKLYIKSDDGQRTIPLDTVVKWNRTLGLQSVTHLNQFTSVTFSFNLKPGVAIGDTTAFIEKSAKETLPSTVQGQLQGEGKVFAETVANLTMLMIVAVLVMYVILGVLYESYLHPLTVLSSLPVALLGGLATLWLFGVVASLYAYVGMFLLMGIVKKNGIMVVDFALHRIAAGDTAEEAIHTASMNRFRPIIMTTMAALMGALPIALGWGADGESRRPLGLVIVGGLIVSQFITLYVTPVIYLYLEVIQEKVLNRTSFFRSSHLVNQAVAAPAHAAAAAATGAGHASHREPALDAVGGNARGH
ncbi:MAG: efflux RND transporter permease subunit [Planctomycetota bacterium]|nr:efflux RND transporter permease subunit [Planctomycetota bacterium]